MSYQTKSSMGSDIADINNDGFDDIYIGNPQADFVDPFLPQLDDAESDAQNGVDVLILLDEPHHLLGLVTEVLGGL